jgi:hypothetical protein
LLGTLSGTHRRGAFANPDVNGAKRVNAFTLHDGAAAKSIIVERRSVSTAGVRRSSPIPLAKPR